MFKAFCPLNKFKNFDKIFKLNKSRKLYSSTTEDPNEIFKFNEFSHKFNWYSSEQLRPLRNLNRLRVPLIRDYFKEKQILNNEKSKTENDSLMNINILDVGCGGGLLSEPLARLGANVVGIDANEANISFANQHCDIYSSNLKSNLKYIHTNIEKFSLQNQNSFDAIVASEVLEHVENVELFVKSANKLLKHNGAFIITTINQSFLAHILAIHVAEKILKLAPKGTHTYDKFVLLNGLKLILEENNFTINLIHGMRLNPLTKSWSWCTDTSINYAIIATKSCK